MELQDKRQYEAVIEKEAKERLKELDQKIWLQEMRLQNLTANHKTLRSKKLKNGGDLNETDKVAMQSFWDDMSECTVAVHKLEKEKASIVNNTNPRHKEAAAEQFLKTNKVEQQTGKNRLYIGNRQFVAAYVEKDATKKKRTLDLGLWTWGINYAWIEGALAAQAEIKIKMNEENPNAFETIPDDAFWQIEANPRMNGKQWLALCEQFPGTILWVNYANENRPSWTALEIKACLDAGYRFVIYQHKKREGQALKLVKDLD